MTLDMRSMGWTSLCVLVLTALTATASAQEAPRFDHGSHVERVTDCSGCHSLAKGTYEQKGRVGAGHKPCNNSICHGNEWTSKPKWSFCNTCHVDAKNLRNLRYPPYRRRDQSDWLVDSFDHKAHIEKAKGACEDCHGDARVRKPRTWTTDVPGNDKTDAGHKACSKCHGKQAQPAMADCTGCHTPRAGRKVGVAKSATWYQDRVRFGFWHKDHEKISKNKDCGSCHNNVMVGKGQAVPLPEMKACESCHDGKTAFDAKGVQCRKCHLVPDGLGKPLPAAQAKYQHSVHEGAGVTLRCDGCHGSSADGKISFPGGNDHKPCSNDGCHGDEFRRSGPRICTTCHDHADPWRSNPARSEFAMGGEFFVGFSHKSHDKRIRDQRGCGTCHPGQAGLPPVEIDASWLAPVHKDCATCHAEFAKPTMTECGGCHELEPTKKKGAETDPKWRVSAKFQHETHRQDPRNKQALDCRACHGDVLNVAPGQRIPRPTMQGCGDCHNGTIAFKATGHDCTKCHGPVRTAPAPATAPASEPN